MEKSWFRENLWKSLVVSLCCLAGAGYGSYLLYYDWMGESARGSGPALAQVARRDQTVRRKSAKSFAWMRAEESDSLYKRDSVQTSAESAAVIKFKNGNLLEIGENSLVVIDDIENLELNFVQGSMILRTEAGDQRLSVSADGKVKVEKIPVRLVAPEPLARVYKEQVEFAWKSGGAATPQVTVLVSSDRSFAPGKTVRLDAGEASTFSTALKPGRWFWRLESQGQSLTEASQFTVVSITPPKPAYPARGEEIATPQLSFRWTGGESAFTEAGEAKFVLEVAADAAFSKVIQTSRIAPETSQQSVSLDPALAGKALYWRTKIEYPGGSSPSRAESFRMLSASEVQKGALALVSPAPEQKLYYWDQPTEFKFAWRSEGGSARAFVLEIADDAEFKNVVATKSLARESISSRELTVPSGVHYWRVRAMDPKDPKRELVRSEARQFAYGQHPPLRAPASVMAKPGQGAEYEITDENANPRLTWEKLDDAQAYQIAVFKDGKAISQKVTKDNFVEIADLPEGKLSWTVRGIDRLKRAGELMEKQEFNLSYGVTLGVPEVTSSEVQ